MGIKAAGKKIEVLLLLVAIVLYFVAPKDYSLGYCIYCFIVFAFSATLLIVNNIKIYKTFFIFEVFFTFSFFFANYAYPVFIYEYDPYFSLFGRSFNEDVITRCTALATVGYVAYSIGQFKEGIAPVLNLTKSKAYSLTPISGVDVFILLVLFAMFLYASIGALRAGYSQSRSVGGGFFYIFSLFYVYKFFAHSRGKSTKFCVFIFFSLIIAYILLNFMLGNRGEPLYLCVAIIYCYHTYVKKISNTIMLVIAAVGLFLFYFIGVTRISSQQVGISSRSERISNLEGEENILRYANEIIINNRSSFVLVDYADQNGHSYGKTWSVNFFSVVPFGQSFAQKVLGIPKKDFSSTHLTTWIEFGDDDPDAFGMGTNLIGDIYLCFGAIGVLVFMLLFGRVVRTVHDKSIESYSYYQMFYIILIALSVYYVRANLFCPLQMLAWSYVLGLLNREITVYICDRVYEKDNISSNTKLPI